MKKNNKTVPFQMWPDYKNLSIYPIGGHLIIISLANSFYVGSEEE